MLKTRARNLVFAVVASALGDGLIPTAFAIQSFKLDSSGRLLTFVLIALWSATNFIAGPGQNTDPSFSSQDHGSIGSAAPTSVWKKVH